MSNRVSFFFGNHFLSAAPFGDDDFDDDFEDDDFDESYDDGFDDDFDE